MTHNVLSVKLQEDFSYTLVPAFSPTHIRDHIVVIGGHVLEDTHETRDGYPMSVYLSFLTNAYAVTVDTNDYAGKA
jgi:hypothetical protein